MSGRVCVCLDVCVCVCVWTCVCVCVGRIGLGMHTVDDLIPVCVRLFKHKYFFAKQIILSKLN